MARTPVLFTLGILLVTALAGCLYEPEEVRLLVDWRDGFAVVVRGPLPDDARLEVTDTTIGKTETITVFQDDPEGKRASLGDGPIAGHGYRLTLFSGDDPVDGRTVLAHDTSGSLPTFTDTPFKARYDMWMTSQEDGMSMKVDGQMDAERAEELLVRLTGTGSMDAEGDGMAMDLELTRFQRQYLGERMQSFRMDGAGTWRMQDGGVQGDGTLTMTERLVGTTTWEDAGATHDTYLMRTVMDMKGAFEHLGVKTEMDMHRTEDMWQRLSDKAALWERWNETTTMRFMGREEVSHDSGEGAPEMEDEGASIGALTEFTGIVPVPPVPGDRYAEGNDLGVRVHFLVGPMESRMIAGEKRSVLPIVGKAVTGLEGDETRWMLASGPLHGLLAGNELAYWSGDDTYEKSLTLVSYA